MHVSHVVNFLKRMAPILAHKSFGNMSLEVEIKEPETDAESNGGIEQNIRRAVRGVDEQFVRMKV